MSRSSDPCRTSLSVSVKSPKREHTLINWSRIYDIEQCQPWSHQNFGPFGHPDFNHSGYFCSNSSSPLLLRGAPHTARILCQSFMPKRNRQLRVKDLPMVPTWWLERDPNQRPSDDRRRIYQSATAPHKCHFNVIWDSHINRLTQCKHKNCMNRLTMAVNIHIRVHMFFPDLDMANSFISHSSAKVNLSLASKRLYRHC